MDVHFVDVTITESKNVPHVVKSLQETSAKWLKRKENEESACNKYKVFGEARAIMILKGNVEDFVEHINLSVGSLISTTCIPLRFYENFARSQNVDESLCQHINPSFENAKKIFFTTAIVEHPDISTKECYKMWHEEAKFALSMRKEGTFDFRAYKVLAQRVIYVFFNMESADSLDDALLQLPMVKSLGANIHFDCKQVKQF